MRNIEVLHRYLWSSTHLPTFLRTYTSRVACAWKLHVEYSRYVIAYPFYWNVSICRSYHDDNIIGFRNTGQVESAKLVASWDTARGLHSYL